MSKYYVYAHKHPATKEPFYIGAGSGNRAFEKTGRTDPWREFVSELKKEGLTYSVEILHVCDTIEVALELEKAEIGKHKNLLNIQNYHPLEASAQPSFDAVLKDIGNRIKNARIAQNIPLCNLAKSIKMSRVTLAKIESGKSSTFEISNLLKILDKLDLHLRIP